MSRNMPQMVSLCGAAALFACTHSASAQWFSAGDSCGCSQPVVPVVQSCYQTVPVTEYRQVKQTVQRPVVETAYVDQAVTEYRPVVEHKTASIPTVAYQDVTEMQTVCRNCGYWQTSYQCNPRVSPCQYDPRPGFGGWLNRTGYSVRSAFTPRYTTRRDYIPQTVVQQIPVTRRVAQYGTREVAYDVTHMVAQQTTRKVAVNTVRLVAEEVTTMQPVTVMRTIPTGTSLAYAGSSYGFPSATAIAPIPDSIGTARAIGQSQSADRSNAPEPFKRDATNVKPNAPFDGKTSSIEPPGNQVLPAGFEQPSAEVRTLRSAAGSGETQVRAARPVPSVVRASRWMPHNETTAIPTLAGQAITLADRNP